MKVKIQVLAMMFIAALAFSACSDDDDNDRIAVPAEISQALLNKYPSASRIEWEQKGNYYVADCKVAPNEMDVWFNAQGVWLLTEVDLIWNALPVEVQTGFNSSSYATWERDDYDLLEYPGQPLQYVIEVEKGNTEYQLFFSKEGKLVEGRDVTNKDDTHWPIEKR